MNWWYKQLLLILALHICATVPIFATDDCDPCEEAEDQTLVNAGFDPCKPKSAGTDIPGIWCKECDGNGGQRNKPDGTQVELNGSTAYCCGGVLHIIGPKPDGCYKVVDCEWRQFTPDCKAYEDMVIKLELIIHTCQMRLIILRSKRDDADLCCQCGNGSISACAIMGGMDRCTLLGLGCAKLASIDKMIDYLNWLFVLAEKELDDANILLDDCKNCKE